jgi:hypothetical protein
VGFVKPRLPELDYQQWRTQPRMARTKPIVQHWGTVGFGTPDGVYLLYLAKIAGYVAGAIFFAALTPGFSLVGEWWTDPVVYMIFGIGILFVHNAQYGLGDLTQPLPVALIAGMALGWNFGDGHLHNEQLLEALQERCHFDEGEVRVIILDGQPIHRQQQAYRLVDAAHGEFERGHVRVRDMRHRQPWDGSIPVAV